MLILSPEFLLHQRQADELALRDAANDAAPGAVEDARYEALAARARTAEAAGQLTEALRHYGAALAEARQLGDPERVDRATCNRLSMVIALGRRDEAIAPLRTVLMRRLSPSSAFLAADGLSWVYELAKDYKKGLFYAQVARNHAKAADRTAWLASSLNQTGNCLVGDSRFAEAAEAYRAALELLPTARSEERAGVLLNLGYCAAVMDDMQTAFDLAFRSLRWGRHFGNRRLCGWAHLDLCHAYVQIGRLVRALEHGRRALGVADETAESDLVKNALFMLGEANSQAGNTDAARDLFTRLQQTFYPDQPDLVALMLAVDLRPMVNLRA